jgi:uncharacterized protein YqeY
MSLLKNLDDDLKAALKSSDKLKLSVIRLIKAALINKQIAVGKDLTDDEILSVFSSLAKQRKESIDQFEQGGRKDLAEKERQELTIIQSYLPEQLSDEKLQQIILEAIRESSAKGESDIGKVMKILMPRIKGVADGKLVNSRVRELLRSSQN